MMGFLKQVRHHLITAKQHLFWPHEGLGHWLQADMRESLRLGQVPNTESKPNTL